MERSSRVLSPLLILAIFAAIFADSATDPSDVQGLQVMYTAFNNPSQLSNWKASGGDPCGESWKGVTCQGSAVVSIQISGLGLSGTMGYLLTNFLSLKTLDMSGNNVHDSIPYQLPPNLTSLNLANNNLSGNLPYSLSTMTSLSYLNVSRNSLSQSVGDLFANLVGLATLDLSVNNFSSDFPLSFSALSNLSTLHVQNNQFTGSLNVLTGLPLTDLNVADNHLTGWIPKELSSIPNFVFGGNTFDNGPAPPPPPYTSPPPSKGHKNRTRSPPSDSGGRSSKDDENKNNGLSARAIIGISVGSSVLFLIALLALLFCCIIRKGKRKEFPTGASTGSLPISSDKGNFSLSSDALVFYYYKQGEFKDE